MELNIEQLQSLGNFLMGAFLMLAFFSVIQTWLDKALISSRIYLSDMVFTLLSSSLLTTFMAIVFVSVSNPDDKALPLVNVAELIGVTFLAFVYLTLPAVAKRRVVRVESIAKSKGVFPLSEKMARKRIMAALPFIINPLALIVVLRLIMAKQHPLYATAGISLAGQWNFVASRVAGKLNDVKTQEAPIFDSRGCGVRTLDSESPVYSNSVSDMNYHLN